MRVLVRYTEPVASGLKYGRPKCSVRGCNRPAFVDQIGSTAHEPEQLKRRPTCNDHSKSKYWTLD